MEREVLQMPFDWKTRVELKLHELDQAQFLRKQAQDLVTSDEPSLEGDEALPVSATHRALPVATRIKG